MADKPGATNRTSVHLSVHPSVVFQLGADLISDDVQALVELIKNGYDADSKSVRVEIDTETWTDLRTGAEVPAPPPKPKPKPKPKDAADSASNTGDDAERERDAVREDTIVDGPVQGLIRVIDRGVGMSVKDIERGWLTVSLSPKREMKRLGHKTPGLRTPLGDKGLGRLGTQRLGRVVEIETTPKVGDQTHSLRLAWSEFAHADSLNQVPLELVSRPRGGRSAGTVLTVRGLRDVEAWRSDQLVEFERELSGMISPYRDHGFQVSLTAEGEPIDLAKRPRGVRDHALVRYALRFDSRLLTVSGRIKADFFAPNDASDRAEFQTLVADDGGVAFRNWLLTNHAKAMDALGLSEGDDGYFLEARMVASLDDLNKTALDEQGRAVDPGPFNGEVDSVLLRTDPTKIFDSLGEYRDFVRRINGVRIYRDGFGIPIDSDWMGLGQRWTKGTSFYNLRPENVVGFIDLTAEYNSALQETTNREGFQDGAAYRNFIRIIEEFRSFTERVQGGVRRRYNEYRQERAEQDSPDIDLAMDPEAIVSRARDREKKVQSTLASVKATESALEAAADQIEKFLAEDNLFPPPTSLAPSLDVVRRSIEATQTLTSRIADLQRDFDQSIAEFITLRGRAQTLQEQLASAWEAVSLGITAEALSHEIHQIADGLRARSVSVTRHLQATQSKDLTIASFVEHVRSSAAALNRQLSHLDPAMRYMREQRSSLVMSSVAADQQRYFSERWEQRRIVLQVQVERDFAVNMNAGKLSQVFDNLLLNSEFWLREQMRKGQLDQGIVRIVVRKPYVLISDNGPGFPPAVQDIAFEPFVTTKARGRGRGLGLFVVRQLLDAEGASVDLDPTLGDDGRRRTVRITFPTSEKAPRA